MHRIEIIDSHTGGEPTRLIVAGGPDLGDGPLAERLQRFRADFDHYRQATIGEPRGSDVLVGALLCPPTDRSAAAGVIFFNNVGYLGMCGHGAIGVAVTLGHLGRIAAGVHRLETPVGIVRVHYDGGCSVTLQNVPSYRLAAGVRVNVAGLGEFTGDIAWGGNWFFLIGEHQERLELANAARLTDVTSRIKTALRQSGITGAGGAEIDHIELFGPPLDPKNHARNFVLCPGGAYDRSPCGTGTSAKIACLASDGKLRPGELWRQESILGSVFEASFDYQEGEREPGRLKPELRLVPRITGQAHVTAEATLIIDDADPLGWGIGSDRATLRNAINAQH